MTNCPSEETTIEFTRAEWPVKVRLSCAHRRRRDRSVATHTTWQPEVPRRSPCSKLSVPRQGRRKRAHRRLVPPREMRQRRSDLEPQQRCGKAGATLMQRQQQSDSTLSDRPHRRSDLPAHAVPHFDRPIRAAGEQNPPVGRDGNRSDGLSMARWCRTDQLKAERTSSQSRKCLCSELTSVLVASHCLTVLSVLAENTTRPSDDTASASTLLVWPAIVRASCMRSGHQAVSPRRALTSSVAVFHCLMRAPSLAYRKRPSGDSARAFTATSPFRKARSC